MGFWSKDIGKIKEHTMPRLQGQQTDSVSAFVAVLTFAALALIILEYYGITNLLPNVGLL